MNLHFNAAEEARLIRGSRCAPQESVVGPRLPWSGRPLLVRLLGSTGRTYVRRGGGRRDRVWPGADSPARRLPYCKSFIRTW